VLFVLAVVAAILWVPGPWGIALIVVGGAIEIGEAFVWWHWSRRRRATVGVETLVGRRAVVVGACRPDGQVRLDGELWRARCADGAGPDEHVVVEAVDGLTLVVAPDRGA